jgi:hypothetical protein
VPALCALCFWVLKNARRHHNALPQLHPTFQLPCCVCALQWGTLTSLETLDVSSNHLSGSLPDEWSGLTQLRELWLTNNTFTVRLKPGSCVVTIVLSFRAASDIILQVSPHGLLAPIQLAVAAFECLPMPWIGSTAACRVVSGWLAFRRLHDVQLGGKPAVSNTCLVCLPCTQLSGHLAKLMDGQAGARASNHGPQALCMCSMQPDGSPADLGC